MTAFLDADGAARAACAPPRSTRRGGGRVSELAPVGGPRPLVEQVTPWRQVPAGQVGDGLLGVGALHVEVYERDVGDGRLMAIVSQEPTGPGGIVEWHMSISHSSQQQSARYPTWDEIAHARYALLPDRLLFALLLPPGTEYVSLHPTTFHLYELHP